MFAIGSGNSTQGCWVLAIKGKVCELCSLLVGAESTKTQTI